MLTQQTNQQQIIHISYSKSALSISTKYFSNIGGLYWFIEMILLNIDYSLLIYKRLSIA